MRTVTYTMGLSLDGYVIGPDGGFDFSAPSDEVFEHHLRWLRRTGAHLLGRRLHEAMLYWDGDDWEAAQGAGDPVADAAQREWARLWRALPKVVFSRTLTEVTARTSRLATGTLAEEIARLRAEPGEGDIAVGGAALAAQAAAADLIDEYHALVHPVLVGGGTPFFARDERRVDLELVETRTFDSGVVFLRHRVKR